MFFNTPYASLAQVHYLQYTVGIYYIKTHQCISEKIKAHVPLCAPQEGALQADTSTAQHSLHGGRDGGRGEEQASRR